MTKQALTPGEKLEMSALKNLALGSPEDLLSEFGFDSKKVTFAAERFLGKQIKKDDTQHSRLDKPPVVTENPFAKDLDDLSAEGAADFFNQLGNQSQKAQQKQQEEAKKEKMMESSPHHDIVPHSDPNQMVLEQVSMNSNWNEGHERLIKENLLIGNLQYAAEIALKCGRSTVAFLIAERGGADLL